MERLVQVNRDQLSSGPAARNWESMLGQGDGCGQFRP